MKKRPFFLDVLLLGRCIKESSIGRYLHAKPLKRIPKSSVSPLITKNGGSKQTQSNK